MDQNDIDALMSGMPEPDDESTGAGDAGVIDPQSEPEGAADDSVGVDQSDIAALMAQAQQLAGDDDDTSDDGADDVMSATPPSGAWDSTGKPLDEAGAAMAAAIAAEQAEQAAKATQAPATPPQAALPTQPVEMPDFDVSEYTNQANQPLSLLYDVEMHVKIELGRTQMYVEDILKLGQGSVVELDRFAGDPVDVYVNGRLVARGEVLVLNDNFCVRVSEIVSNPEARLVG